MNKRGEKGNSQSGVVKRADGTIVYRKIFLAGRQYEFCNEYLCSRFLYTLDKNITAKIISIDYLHRHIDYEVCSTADNDSTGNFEYVELVRRVHRLTTINGYCKVKINASQPMVRLDQFLLTMGNRIHILDQVKDRYIGYTEEMKDICCRIREEYEKIIRQLSGEKLTTGLCFSQADSGMHNCVRGLTGGLLLADLEYAGRDSPLKQCMDYLLHPKCQSDISAHEEWWSYFENEIIDICDRRLMKHIGCALCLKWSIIMLNEFLPDVWKRRITADESRISKREVILTRQLRKARIYLAACDKLRGGSEHYGLFEKGERDILSCPY